MLKTDRTGDLPKDYSCTGASSVKKRIGRILALACVTFLTASIATPAIDNFRPSDEDLYFDALREEVVEKVNTVTVRTGDFYSNVSYRGSLEYENVQYVFNTNTLGNITFDGWLVASGDKVKAGDPVCKIKISADTSDSDLVASRLELCERNLEEFVEVNEALLDEYQYYRKNAASESDRVYAGLLYDRLYVTYNEEVASRQEEIESLRQTLADYETIESDAYITAGVDGTVAGMNRFRKGDTLREWTYICAVYDTSRVKVVVDQNAEYLRYNDEVTVLQALGSGNVEMKGRVVSCNSAVLSPTLIGRNTVIELFGDTSAFKVDKEITVKTYSVSMKNALLVPKSAVEVDAKGSFVYVYEDGSPVKRYILTGGTNASDTWVVKGLKEGDELVTK